MDDVVSAGYDAVFGAMLKSPTLRRRWRKYACGLDFPDEFSHLSFFTLDELDRVASELQLQPGQTLVDVGCGMGGPALWLARKTGARLVGIDASRVGVTLASERAQQLGLAAQARFVVGTFADTGLEEASANAVISEDALQYAPDKRAAFVEAARILRRGGRFVFTAFELEPERVAGLPVLGTDPMADFTPALRNAGFSVDLYEEVPGWPEPMTSAYAALVAEKDALRQEMGALAVSALLSELNATLAIRPYRRRVLACATKR